MLQLNVTSLDNTVESSFSPYDFQAIKISVQKFALECDLRGLHKTKIWLSELNYSLIDVPVEEDIYELEIDSQDYETYLMANSLFPLHEYARASYFIKSVNTERATFLNFFCMYKVLEQNKPMDFTDMNTTTKWDYFSCLKKLNEMLQNYLAQNPNDGFVFYLKGLVSIKLGSRSAAIDSFCKAVHQLPLLWEAWDELSQLINDRITLSKLNLPSHWMKEFFLGQTYTIIQRNEDALNTLEALQDNGFSKSLFVLSKIAAAHYNRRESIAALNLYQRIHTEDPFRIEDLNTYSDLLFVGDKKKELAHLAHHVFSINRYTAQTCCVVGNYFSSRKEHAKSAGYFQRAVKLNSNFLSALILRGHEFMEMKNTRGAITSYRDVVAMDPQDYRAWYGFGQTYEILNMPFYALHYHKRAQLIRPDGSSILIALGDVFVKLNRFGEAIRCYKRARNVGDEDSLALLGLARLYTELNEEEEAADAYKQFVKESTTFNKEYADACKYLAYYYLKLCQFHLAFQFAQKCLHFEETKEEGKALLKEIATRRELDEHKQYDNQTVNANFFNF